MNKFELLQAIQKGLDQNIISTSDLRLMAGSGNSISAKVTSLDYGKIFSLIGGLIIFLGLSSLIGLYWRDMNSLLRVGSTLGVGLILFSAASFIMVSTKQRFTGLALHLVAPVLIAFGANVLLFDIILGSNPSLNATYFGNFLAYLIIFTLYLAADYLIQSKLFSFVAWIAGTVAYWFAVTFFIQFLNISTYILYENKVFAIFGLLYCFAMFYMLYLNDNRNSKKVFNDVVLLSTFSYFLNNIFWILSDKLILESLFSLVLFYSIYISIRVNKLPILIASVLGIVFYLTYLSSKYFSNTLGWPVSLILIGLSFVGSGYLFVNLKKKIH